MAETDHAAALEWWYVEGELTLADASRVNVMASLFRAGPAEPAHAAMAFIAVHQGAACIFRESRVSPKMIAVMHDAVDLSAAAGVPRWARQMAKSAYGRIAAWRRQNGLVLAGQDAALPAAPALFDWGALRLTGEAGVFTLRLTASGAAYVLRITPDAPWLSLTAPELPGHLGITSYRSCPSCLVEGTRDGAPITGRVWLDHQSGGMDQLVAVRNRRIELTGWNWFALNAENGDALMIYAPRDLRRGSALQGFGAYWRKGEAPQRLAPFSTHKVAQARGRLSGLSFPRAWIIRAPEHDAELHVEAVSGDGEIPVYGPFGWNWQSPARFSGRIHGAEISGRGWLEQNGYGAPLPGRGLAVFIKDWLRARFNAPASG